jgi:hypothetical protein
MEYSEAGGKLIHEKNQKQKISSLCPFKAMHTAQDTPPVVYRKSNKQDFFSLTKHDSDYAPPIASFICQRGKLNDRVSKCWTAQSYA